MPRLLQFSIVCTLVFACTRAPPTPTAVPRALSTWTPFAHSLSTAAPTAAAEASQIPVSAAPTETPINRYEVITWFLDPEPRLGERVMLFASLLQNGYALSSERMRATWPDKDAPGGTAVCWDKPNYGRGICYIYDTEQYAPGKPVPIKVEMLWLGQWYTAHTSFTPK